MLAAEPAKEESSRYCAYCGKTLGEVVRFCGYCGREIVDSTEREVKSSDPLPSNSVQRSLTKPLLIGGCLVAVLVTLNIYKSSQAWNRSGQPAGSTLANDRTSYGTSPRSRTPAERLRQAEEALKPDSTAAAISESLDQIKAIPESAPEHARAKVVAHDLLQAQQAAKAAVDRVRERALAGMVKQRDEMRNVTVWRDRSMPAYVNSRSWVGAYVMAPDTGEPFLRFVVYYVSHDWLFIERYLFKIDGETYTLIPSEFGNAAVKRDSGELASDTVGIWEWWDVLAENKALAVLQHLDDAKVSSLRCEGRQYYKDRVIGTEERAAIKRTLDAYRAIKSDRR